MKTKDIQVGEEYASGASGPYARFRQDRVVVLAKGVQRQTWQGHRYGTSGQSGGIEVKVLEYGDVAGLADKPGKVEARRPQEIQRLWSEYEPLRREHQEQKATSEREAEEEAYRKAALCDRLKRLGLNPCVSRRPIGLTLDDSGKILDWLALASEAFAYSEDFRSLSEVLEGAAPQDGDGTCTCGKQRGKRHPRGQYCWDDEEGEEDED